jgi:hypothetical protein
MSQEAVQPGFVVSGKIARHLALALTSCDRRAGQCRERDPCDQGRSLGQA